MANSVLDLKGLKCPLPVLKVQKAMKTMTAGDTVEVYATDPLSVIDIPNYCNESGNRLVNQTADGEVHVFKIERT
ncbi:MAG: sulfurtransferase TusA family protein [Pseudomonadota bacterium]